MKKIILFFTCAVLLCSCAKDKGEVQRAGVITDAEFYGLMKSQIYSIYKNNNTPIAAVGPHTGNYLLKFNTKANAALGTDGKLATGTTFPDSSIVVKELYTGGPSPSLYAIMMKLPSSPLAKNGWLWAEYNADGSPIHSIKNDHSGCTGCHSGGRDYIHSFDVHP